jgi:hypothetical protein
MSGLSYPARLFYIGLWCVADDAGWLEWDLDELGALLFPHETPRRRERHIETWSEELVKARRVVVMECGCAVIPTLDAHQKHAGGNRSFQYRDAHRRRHPSVSTDESGPVPEKVAGRVGNGRERNGTLGNGSAGARDDQDQDSEFRRKVPRPVVGAIA